MTGTASEYPPDVLSATQDVIVVTINYRLNILGFLTTNDDKLPGNYGLWDQHLAIRWVHENIDDYGGNKSSVTIFGESAGGRATSFQMFSPQNNRTLFQKVVAESGSAFSLTYLNRDPSEGLNQVLNKTSCPLSDSILKCLQELPLASVMKASMGVARPFPFYPKADGDFLPFDFGVVVANFTRDPDSVRSVVERAGQYDLLAGWNNQEGLIFLGRLLQNSLSIDKQNLSAGVSDRVLTATLQQYPFYKYGEGDNSLIIELFKAFYLFRSSDDKLSDGRSLEDQRVEAFMDIAGRNYANFLHYCSGRIA